MRSLKLPLVLALAASTAAAQTGSQPTLVLSWSMGTSLGHALWDIPRQPLTIPNSSTYDTFALRRAVSPGLVMRFGGTYFPQPFFGWHVEATFLRLPLDNTCTPIFVNPDANQSNQQVCDNLTRRYNPNHAFLFQGGIVLRAAPRGITSPFVRGAVGFAVLAATTVGVDASYVVGTTLATRQIIADTRPRRLSPAASVATGISSSLGEGFRLRIELRDDVLALDRVTGPADGLSNAPRGTAVHHHLSLTLGLDIVLDRVRGRRY